MGLLSKEKCSICGEETTIGKSKCIDGVICFKCKGKTKKYLLDGVSKSTVNEIKEIIENSEGDYDKCDVCGGKLGILNKKCVDGYICSKCSSTYEKETHGSAGKVKINAIKKVYEDVNSKKQRIRDFIATKKIGDYIKVNENNNELIINKKIYYFKDIVSYEVLEDGDTITKGGLGRAVAGGILLGGVGAIVGGVTGKRKTKKIINKLSIRISVDNLNNPLEIIEIINKETKTNSKSYASAIESVNEIISLLEVISRQNEKNIKEINNNNIQNGEFIFCRKCGNKLQSDSMFCSKCGEKVQ